MECDICLRTLQEVREFICASCARNTTYLSRLEYAQRLLERETLSRHVTVIIEPRGEQAAGLNVPDTAQDHQVWLTELAHIHMNEASRKLEVIKRDREGVKKESAELREQIKLLRERIEGKRSTMSTIDTRLPSRRDARDRDVSSEINKATSSLQRTQYKSQETRISMCRDAASLMRLRQRRRQRDTSGREQYSIAGLTLPDLREISNLRCADLSAVLGSVAHLTLRVGFYLGIRLPAQILEPRPDYPLHTIFTPAGSYKGTYGDFPTITVATSQSTSPSSSKLDLGTSTKGRPLFVGALNRDERIFDFQKRDEQTFRYFVEGISLLAWDVAWLCRTQGFTAGTSTWEDICDMGRNLHQLLVANPQAPSMARLQSDRSTQNRPSVPRKQSSAPSESRRETVGKLGQYSDISAAMANTNPYRDILSSWDFVSWHKIVIPLRKNLLTEIASAEWEVLLDEEWDDGEEKFDEAVVVKTRTLDHAQYGDARIITTARTGGDDEASTPPRLPGTSGWTKVKTREKQV